MSFQKVVSAAELPPPRAKLLDEAAMRAVYERACAAYRANRKVIEAEGGMGDLVLIDADDATGRTFTVGSDKTEVELAHYRKYRRAMASACFLRIGDIRD